MITIGVGAHVVQSHLRLGSLGVGLEEDGLPVAALRARVVLGARQRGVRHHVRHDAGDLVHLVHDLVHVNAAAVRHLPVVAVPARVQEDLVLLVLLGVEHVVALLAKSDTNKSWALRHG